MVRVLLKTKPTSHDASLTEIFGSSGRLLEYLRFLGAALFLTVTLAIDVPSLKAQDSPYNLTREENYDEERKKFVAFFDSVPMQKFEGVPYRGRPVALDYKRFVHEDHKALGTVVFVHGFSENFYKYRELYYDFYNNGFNVVGYSQRGHGFSKLLEEDRFVHVDDFNSYVQDLKTLIEQKAKPLGAPVFLFAHSMGGAASALLIQDEPNIVDAAILSTPMLEMNTRGFPKWLARTVTSVSSFLGLSDSLSVGQNPPKNDWTFETGNSHSIKRWEDNRNLAYSEEWIDIRRGGATNGWLEAAFKESAKIMDEERIAKIKIPILIFQAGIDTWVLSESHDQFCEAVPTCTLIRYPESKHEMYIEHDKVRVPYLTQAMDFLVGVSTRLKEGKE